MHWKIVSKILCCFYVSTDRDNQWTTLAMSGWSCRHANCYICLLLTLFTLHSSCLWYEGRSFRQPSRGRLEYTNCLLTLIIVFVETIINHTSISSFIFLRNDFVCQVIETRALDVTNTPAAKQFTGKLM